MSAGRNSGPLTFWGVGFSICIFLSERMVKMIITTYPKSKSIPSMREMSLFMSVVATSANVAAMQMGMSRRMLVLVKSMGENTAHTPRIAKMLNVLEPTILPIAMALSPLRAEIKLTVSSGIDVPTATIVRPTINSGTRKRAAKATEPSVSNIAPKMMRASAPIRIKYSIITYINNSAKV